MPCVGNVVTSPHCSPFPPMSALLRRWPDPPTAAVPRPSLRAPPRPMGFSKPPLRCCGALPRRLACALSLTSEKSSFHPQPGARALLFGLRYKHAPEALCCGAAPTAPPLPSTTAPVASYSAHHSGTQEGLTTHTWQKSDCIHSSWPLTVTNS